ncbi:MAG: hypothetical protein AB7O88_04165 [Reyranellaceae bacterium]
MTWPALCALLAALAATVGVVAMWHWRRRFGRAALIAAASVAALLTLLLASGQTVSLVFESCVGGLLGVAGVTLASALVVRFLFPRLTSRRHAPAVAILSAILVVAQLGAALGLWASADPGAQLGTIPVARSEAEILALRDASRGERLFGVLTEATAGAAVRVQAGGEPRTIASYACGRVGSAVAAFFPAQIEIAFGDGATILAQGPISARGVWNWPESGRRVGECALRAGDPVVIWSDVAEARVIGSGRRVGALVETRLLAQGSLESFRRDYIPRAVFTGRLFIAVAAFAAALALVPLVAGVRRWWHLRRHGAPDTAGRRLIVTWK